MYSELDDRLNDVIDGIKIGLSSDECLWSAIEATVRVLEVIKGLQGNIVGISDAEFESMFLEAIKGQ